MMGLVAVTVGDSVAVGDSETSISGCDSLTPTPSTPIATNMAEPAITKMSKMIFQTGQRRFSTILPLSSD
jgi:hypothetical protein